MTIEERVQILEETLDPSNTIEIIRKQTTVLERNNEKLKRVMMENDERSIDKRFKDLHNDLELLKAMQLDSIKKEERNLEKMKLKVHYDIRFLNTISALFKTWADIEEGLDKLDFSAE